ncbi:MAG: TetR family transcriptional regulator [Alphaproteobacteria bacterium]|nr:TetR family transcriptional regulator [Alphaproteobacteria bacterium]
MAQRDAEATRKNILRAVGVVLERDGFVGLGVNAIAKEAGIGKPLIYRYFGGLAPLLEEFGKDAHFWLGVADIADEADKEAGGTRVDDYAELVRMAIVCYTRILRQRPMMQEIMASELTSPAELIEPLARARRGAAREATRKFMHGVEPPAGVDADAVYAILLSGFQHLVLRARVAEDFWGLPLRSDEDWKRFEKAIGFIIHRVFDPPASTDD